MDIPKPHAPAKAEEQSAPKPVEPKEKPVFVRKPHLTDRPFKGHEGLQALRNSMPQEPRRKPNQRRGGK
jgi:hypothetical protein